MAKMRHAFTLIEVLISIALMGIILVALFSSVDMLQDSNAHLLHHLKKAKKVTKATQVLYSDIIGSDGNITIDKDGFSRVCITHTRNSLYGLPQAKVCWVVLKQNNQLIRVEGGAYHLPLKLEERVEVDMITKDIILFDVYHAKDKVLVLLQQKGKSEIAFMVQGVRKPLLKKKTPQPPPNGKAQSNAPIGNS